MTKKIGIYVHLFLLVLCIFAQRQHGPRISELEKKLPEVSGKARIELLNKLAEHYRKKLPQKSIAYSHETLALSEKIDDQAGKATALANIALSYAFLGKLREAIQYSQKAYLIFQKTGDKKTAAKFLRNMGHYQEELGYFSNSLKNHSKSLEICKEIDDRLGTASSLCFIGKIYSHLGDNEKAVDYCLQSLEISEANGYEKTQAFSLTLLGIIYKKMGRYSRALEYLEQSLFICEKKNIPGQRVEALDHIGDVYQKLRKYDSAQKYLKLSLKLKKRISDEEGIAFTSYNLGKLYLRQNRLKTALRCFMEALEITKKGEGKLIDIRLLNSMAETYLKQGKIPPAIKSLIQALSLAEQTGSKDLIKECYHCFSDIFAVIGEHRLALQYFKKYIEIKDRIYSKESSEAIARIQAQYDTLKKEKEIKALKQAREIQELRLSRAKIARNALILGLLLVLVIVGLLLKKYLYLFGFWKRQKYIGQFQLMEEIGSGGIGTVYKARNIRDKSEAVAIKVLKPELFQDESSRKRFKHEAAVIDKLDHPHIVYIFERGEYKERLYIVMEFLQGKTLAREIAEQGPMELSAGLHIMIQITDALKLIHGKEIVHRDLKPSNIMLVEREGNRNFVKLLDFGLAKTKFQTRVTRTGVLMGTLNYMAPEQLAHSQYSFASDVYSLGVTFYEMVTGKMAFPGETATDIMKQVLDNIPVEPNRFRPDIPPTLNDLIMTMLAKTSDQRPTAKRTFEILQMIRAGSDPE